MKKKSFIKIENKEIYAQKYIKSLQKKDDKIVNEIIKIIKDIEIKN